MSSGSAWPSNDGPNALVLTGVSDRAAGIGFFFLRLNHVTRNPARPEQLPRRVKFRRRGVGEQAVKIWV